MISSGEGQSGRRSGPAGRNPDSTGDAIDPGSVAGTAAVGVDVVGISAFAGQLAEPGTRFAQVFTPAERRAAGSGEGSPDLAEAQSLAARWAAKEAVIKAWSSTCFGHPEVIDPEFVDLREIEVRSDAWGRPAIRLHGAIAQAMAGYDVMVSLSHDPAADVAVAFVVLQPSQLGADA